jgi:hypothetical protein
MFTFKELVIEMEEESRPHWLASRLPKILNAYAQVLNAPIPSESLSHWLASHWLWLRTRRTRSAVYHLKDSAQEQPVGIVRLEHWAKAKWYAVNRCRSVVRQCSDNQVVLMLYHRVTMHFEIVRIYDADDQLSGYCIGGFKASLKDGFIVDHADRTPFATARKSPGGYHLTCAKTERALGTVIRESGASAAPGATVVRYRVSPAEEASEQSLSRFYLLAAAMAIVHSNHGWLA